MHRLFLGNFDFEHSLSATAARGGGTRPDVIARLGRELACVWTAAADDGDFLWLPAAVEQGFFDELAAHGLPAVRPVLAADEIELPVEACPWGWTGEVRRQCDKYGWKYAAPPQDVVREVNSRRFSLELERAWGIGLEGAGVVLSVDELAAALRRVCETHRRLIGCVSHTLPRWVLKAEFGMSARERVLGAGTEPNEQTVNWLRKRLETGEAAVLEPWVERIEEAGLQFTVPLSGDPRFEGVAPLLCDASGQYRGNRLTHDTDAETRWTPAVETGLRVARLLQQRGYFGPLGIDAMRYRGAEGSDRFRPVQDINARHTMGRLALGLRRLLKPGEVASWLHVNWPTDEVDAPRRWFEALLENLPAGVRVVRTSPFTVANQPVAHGTLVAAADCEAALQAAKLTVFKSAGLQFIQSRTR